MSAVETMDASAPDLGRMVYRTVVRAHGRVAAVVRLDAAEDGLVPLPEPTG